MSTMKKPFTIGIGGTHSGSGKTTIAAALIKYLTKDNRRWGAIKYTKTRSQPLIVTGKKNLTAEGKDTFRLLMAGASEVVWVKSPASGLNKVLPEAAKKLSYLEGIIIEGNSAIEFLKPDIVIFIFGEDKNHWKSGIERLFTDADIILYQDESELPETAKTKRLFHVNPLDIEEHRGFFRLISRLTDERRTERRDA